MEEITLEKTYALLEKLAEHVINEIPIKREVDEKFQRVYDAIWELKEEKADKKDLEILKKNLEMLLDGQDKVIKELEIVRIEQYATSATLDRHEQRLNVLES